MYNGAVIEVTYELLVQALGLPEGTKIVAITQEPKDVLGRRAQLLVEGDHLPCVAEGGEPPRMVLDGLPDVIFEIDSRLKAELEDIFKRGFGF